MENVIISKNIKSVSGVYGFWNIENGKIYIGSSKNIKSRINNHLSKLRNGRHENKEMQKDFDDGNKFMVFNVLEVDNTKNLRYFENISIIRFDAINKGYNKQPITEHETREENKIRLIAGELDYYYNGADNEDKRNIETELLNN